jgi:hypothetical protein
LSTKLAYTAISTIARSMKTPKRLRRSTAASQTRRRSPRRITANSSYRSRETAMNAAATIVASRTAAFFWVRNSDTYPASARVRPTP